MSDEPNKVIPSPDPSTLTTAAIERVVLQRDELVFAQLAVRDANLGALRESMETRLTAIDKATTLFADSLVRVPTDVDKQVGNLKELLMTRFAGVDQRFLDLASRTTEDKRVAQEALVAALAAAKELVGKQNEFSAAAIDKSETNTNKTIEKNRELAEAVAAAIGRQVDDMKDTVNAIRTELAGIASTALSGHANKDDQLKVAAAQFQKTATMFSAIGLVLAVITIGVAIFVATGR